MHAAPSKRRQQIIEFGGINYGEGYSDGELRESLNLRADLYPCLSPIRGRGEKAILTSPGGIFAADDLFYVDGEKLYRNGEELGGVTAGEKELLRMNSKLVIFPDKVYFNLEDKDNFELTREEPLDWDGNYTAYFTYDEEAEEYSAVEGEEAPGWTTDRYYRYSKVHPLEKSISLGGGSFSFTANSIRFQRDSLYELYPAEVVTFEERAKYYYYNDEGNLTFNNLSGQISFKGTAGRNYSSASEGDLVHIALLTGGSYFLYNADNSPGYGTVQENYIGVVRKVIERHESSGASSDSSWVTIEVQVYKVREKSYSELVSGFEPLFRPGDAVEISGSAVSPENDRCLIIRDVKGAELIFDDGVFTATTNLEPGTVKISRTVPDFDVCCEYNNRIWGAGDGKIYASALGDPTNFNVFDGLASDSYAVAVASAGEFTGCIGYSGSVLFFKENMMYKLMGDYPANFSLISYNVAGVAKGSGKSLANINERLFYHSRDGVYIYTGSTPQLISHNFGMKRHENATAAGFDTKYYISMKDRDSGKTSLFTYDTLRGIWLREDDSDVLGFAELGPEKLMLCRDGRLLQIDEKDSSEVEWCAETCEFTEYINERKCYSRLALRMDKGTGSSFKVLIRCDRGRWETVYQSHYYVPGEFRNAYTDNIILRPKRCDRFSIRIEGKGEVILRSLIREYEIGSEV